MGACFSCNEPKIRIIDKMPEGKDFGSLRPKGILTYSIDKT